MEVARVSSSLRCPICSNKGVKSAVVVTDPESGEIICSDCGMVIGQNIEDNTRPEMRSFGSEGGTAEGYGKSRTGMPTSLARHDKGQLLEEQIEMLAVTKLMRQFVLKWKG